MPAIATVAAFSLVRSAQALAIGVVASKKSKKQSLI